MLICAFASVHVPCVYGHMHVSVGVGYMSIGFVRRIFLQQKWHSPQ